jgi:hypothetical protein
MAHLRDIGEAPAFEGSGVEFNKYFTYLWVVGSVEGCKNERGRW